MTERFEKVGSIIYGTQRLTGALEAISACLKQNLEATAKEKDTLNLNSTQLADLYFEKNPHLNTFKLNYLTAINSVALLENEIVDLEKKDASAIDDTLKIIKSIHLLLADVIQGVGVSDYSHEALRRKGESIL